MRLLKYFLSASLIFTALFFVGYFFLDMADEVTCLSEKFCLSAVEMGKAQYSIAIAALEGFFYSFCVFLAYYVYVITWAAVVKKPYVAWAVVGSGVFTALALLNVSLKKPYMSDLQLGLMPYIVTLDILSAALIIIACTINARREKTKPGIYSKLLTLCILSIFFLNIVTLANEVSVWKDISSILIMIGFLDLLLSFSIFKKSR